MKWIGQHIWDFISRFRSDVYLEATETGTIASGGNLGLDSNNKIVKAASGSGDLTITNASNDRVVTSTGGTGLNAETDMTFDGSTLGLLSSTSGMPSIYLINSHDGASPMQLAFFRTATGEAGDDIGQVDFFHDNDNNQNTSFAQILTEIQDVNDGEEAGKMHLKVATASGGTSALQQALTATGHGTSNIVDVDLGYGFLSTTTAAGSFQVNGFTSTFTNATQSIIKIINTGSNTNGGDLEFRNERSAGVDGDDCGIVAFYGNDDGGNATQVAEIRAEIPETADGSEKGSIDLDIKTASGTTLRNVLNGSSSAADVVDINLGFGTTSTTTIAGDLTTLGDDISISSANSGKPLLELKSTNTTRTAAPELKFLKDAANVEDGEQLGKISFYGDNDAGTPEVISYAEIVGFANDMTDGAEEGLLTLRVASHDGELQSGLYMVSGDAEDEVDVTIGSGTTSLTTIAGDLTVRGGDIIGPTDDNLHIESDGDIHFAIDTDNDATNYYLWNVNGTPHGSRVVMILDEEGVLTVGDIGSTKPQIKINDIADDANGPELIFNKQRGSVAADGQDNDIVGNIYFTSYDDGTPSTQTYSQIKSTIADATSGQEAGKLELQVAEYDGTVTTGLTLDGDTNADGEVDVTLGAGAASTTTIAGTLTMGSTAAINNGGELVVGAQPNITSMTGMFNGNAGHILTDDGDGTCTDQPGVKIETTLTATSMTIMSPQDSGDRLFISCSTHGATNFRTTDDDATAAHLTFDVDGNIELDASAGTIELLDDGAQMVKFTTSGMQGNRKFTMPDGSTHFEHQGDVLFFGDGSTTQGDLCYLKEDGSWGQADADGAATGDDADRDAMGMLAIALGTDPAVDGMFIKGVIVMDYDCGDCGNPIYVSTTAGDMTSIPPTASGDFVRVVGYCLHDGNGQIYFNPDNTWVEIA